MSTSPIVVVMGVSGSGKSTVGELLAERLAVPFVDADDLHPESNVTKMAAGHPLTDEDRWPWLDVVGDALGAASTRGLVMACSTLRRSYRDAILRRAPQTVFVHLHGTRELLAERMGARTGHFMPTALLDSQLATLEELGRDEPGFVVDIAPTPGEIVGQIADKLIH